MRNLWPFGQSIGSKTKTNCDVREAEETGNEVVATRSQTFFRTWRQLHVIGSLYVLCPRVIASVSLLVPAFNNTHLKSTPQSPCISINLVVKNNISIFGDKSFLKLTVPKVAPEKEHRFLVVKCGQEKSRASEKGS